MHNTFIVPACQKWFFCIFEKKMKWGWYLTSPSRVRCFNSKNVLWFSSKLSMTASHIFEARSWAFSPVLPQAMNWSVQRRNSMSAILCQQKHEYRWWSSEKSLLLTLNMHSKYRKFHQGSYRITQRAYLTGEGSWLLSNVPMLLIN